MSRGLGRVERAILAAVADDPHGIEVSSLVMAVYATDYPTAAQSSATRRAAHRLAERGLIRLTYEPRLSDPFASAWKQHEELIVHPPDPALPPTGPRVYDR